MTCDPGNYRPISLTCICCKLMEHIIASNLTKHLNKHNVLYDLQHGFREKRSCETVLIQLVDELARGLSQDRQTDLILLDFSKAFGKVSHTKLLFKLRQHGITQNNLSWIKAFLLGRSQCVALEGEKSSEIPVTSGVPQGSVLGPILFLLYINDLPENITSQVRLFADDTAVYLTVTSKKDSQTLQQDLQTLEQWEKTWEMHFNPSKCQVMHISRAHNPIQTQYVLHGQVLEAVDHAKYLGLEISHDLKWNHHVQNVTTKANRTLGYIRRNIRTKHKGIRQTAYQTLVRPQLEYASPVWSPHTDTNVNLIETVQRRAARWVTHNYSSYSSVTQMINTLGWRSLEQRRADARLLMFYKIVHGLVEIPLPTYIQRQIRMTRTTHSYHFIQIQTSSNYYKYSFFPLAIVQWNNLPPSAVLLEDLTSFRSAICSLNHKCHKPGIIVFISF